MKIIDIFENYKKCVLCDSDNIIIFKKRTSSFSNTNDLYIEKKDDKIIIKHLGSFNLLLCETVIDISTDNVNISINNHLINYKFSPEPLELNFTLFCPSKTLNCNEKDYTDPFSTKKSDEKQIITDNGSHYKILNKILIDQKNKRVLNCCSLKEFIENENYTIAKNYENTTTKITRKAKSLNLPFIYNKSLKDFDFSKLEINSELMK
jgi:hypothetical protein